MPLLHDWVEFGPIGCKNDVVVFAHSENILNRLLELRDAGVVAPDLNRVNHIFAFDGHEIRLKLDHLLCIRVNQIFNLTIRSFLFTCLL